MTDNLPAKSEFLVYQTEDGRVKLDVRLENETVWLTQQMMTDLFQSSKQNISHHIQSIYDEGELLTEATVKKYLTVRVAHRAGAWNEARIILLACRSDTCCGPMACMPTVQVRSSIAKETHELGNTQ